MSAILLALGLLAQPDSGEVTPPAAPESPPAVEAAAPEADAPAETPGDTPTEAPPSEAGDTAAEAPPSDPAAETVEQTAGETTPTAEGEPAPAPDDAEPSARPPAPEPTAAPVAVEPVEDAAPVVEAAPAEAIVVPEELPDRAAFEPEDEVVAPGPETLRAAPVEEPAGPAEGGVETAAPGETEGQDTEWVRLGGSYEPVSGKEKRTFSVMGYLMYRTLMVSDQDPLNGMSLWAILRGHVHLFEGAKVWARLSFEQKFVAEPGEEGFLFEDLRLGFDYTHELSLDFIPIESEWLQSRSIQFMHRGVLFMPTSRESQNRDLHLSIRARDVARMNLVAGLDIILDVFLQGFLNEYAEQAGLHGGQNPQFSAYLAPALEYTFAELPFIPGEIAIGLDVYGWWVKKYDSGQNGEQAPSAHYGEIQGSPELVEQLASAYADDTRPRSKTGAWTQDVGWDFWVDYTPIPYFTLEMSVEHGCPWLRYGTLPPVSRLFVDRDYTEFVVRLIGRY